MIPTIGLIVVVYAVARLIQVPIEFSKNQEKLFGMPVFVRFLVLSVVSVSAIAILAILALILLASSLDSPGVR